MWYLGGASEGGLGFRNRKTLDPEPQTTWWGYEAASVLVHVERPVNQTSLQKKTSGAHSHPAG
jgi:hypothetical protein